MGESVEKFPSFFPTYGVGRGILLRDAFFMALQRVLRGIVPVALW